MTPRRIEARTWDCVPFSAEEFQLTPDEVERLPWVAARIASVHYIGSGVEVRLGPCAGTLVVNPDLIIDVRELVRGTVAACLKLTRVRHRAVENRAPGAQRFEPTAAVAQMFVDLCSEWVRTGALKEYVTKREAITKPRGRIDIPGTLQGPRARGHFERVVCRWRQLTEDTSLNRMLLSAAVRAEKILRGSGEDSPAARLLLVALSGAEFYPNPELRIFSSSPEVEDIVGLASTLIRGVPIALSPGSGGEPVSAWFNVEQIFEEAVREICRRGAGQQNVSSGRENGVKIFHSLPNEAAAVKKIAEPDVVIDGVRSGPLILDAKYRRSGENAAEDQLYQLITHAVAYRATAAALVAPALEGPQAIKPLGRIATGCRIDIVSVDPSSAISMETGINEWLSKQGAAAKVASDRQH